MSVDHEQRQLILLRILGFSLILVGFTMLARNVEHEVPAVAAVVSCTAVRPEASDTHCRRVHMSVHGVQMQMPPLPPMPPMPPMPSIEPHP